MKCIYCNADLAEGQNKCEYCGKVQGENAVETNNVEPVVEQNNPVPEYNNQPSYPEYDNKGQNKVIWILLLISIGICIGACFLPYFSVLGYNQNYVYSGEKVLDGVFVVAFGAVAILLLLFKKRIPVLIFQILSCLVFFYDYFNAKQDDIYGLFGSLYGVGFYLLLIFIIISVGLALVRVIKKDKFY